MNYLHFVSTLNILSVLVFSFSFTKIASADPGKYHRSDTLFLEQAKKAAEKQNNSEKEQLLIEDKQIRKETEQHDFEERRADYEHYRVSVLKDLEKVNASLEYAKQLGDTDLISEREADQAANLKLLKQINLRIEENKNFALIKLREAQELKNQAFKKYEDAQAELNRIKTLDYEILRSKYTALSDRIVNSNILDAHTLMQQKRNIIADLRNMSEDNERFYLSQKDQDQISHWQSRRQQHDEEMKILDVQINLYNSVFLLMTVLFSISGLILKNYLKKGGMPNTRMLDNILSIAESFLRDDLFRDFQESLTELDPGSPVEKLIKLGYFVYAEFKIRQEDEKDPNHFQSTGGGRIAPEVENPKKKPQD